MWQQVVAIFTSIFVLGIKRGIRSTVIVHNVQSNWSTTRRITTTLRAAAAIASGPVPQLPLAALAPESHGKLGLFVVDTRDGNLTVP